MSAMPIPFKYEMKNGDIRWRIRFRTANNRSTDKSGFRTKGDAVAWWRENGTLIDRGVLLTASGGKTRMELLIESYLSDKAGLSPSTIARKESQAKNYVRPYWTGWQVGAITKREVGRWVDWMEEDRGAGAATIKKCHEILVTVMRIAVEDGLIARNPAVGARLPKQTPSVHPYLTFEELGELRDAIDPRYRTMLVMLAFTGLRIGEASALKVKHIDFERKRMSIYEAHAVTGGVIRAADAKGHRLRSVPFSEILVDPLRDQVKGKGRDALVFPSPGGYALRHDTWRPRFFRRAIDTINKERRARAASSGETFQSFPDVTPHGLRHTAASLAIKAGGNVKSVQKLLGHSSATTTIDLYVDLFDSDVDDVADALASMAREANFTA